MALYLFTYGTLQIGWRNHSRIASSFVHAEPASTSGWLMWHVSPGEFPALLPGPGEVHGTLFTFGDEDAARVLRDCDALEDYWPDDAQNSRYMRHEVHVTRASAPHAPTPAWLYGWNPLHAELLRRLGTPVASGDWASMMRARGG